MVDSVLYPCVLRFVGRDGVVGVALHSFSALDPAATTTAWQAWFAEVYA